jgi:hypothetical protein
MAIMAWQQSASGVKISRNNGWHQWLNMKANVGARGSANGNISAAMAYL